VDTGIVTNIIESIIDFNKDNKNSSFETLYTLEENELEMFILQSSNTATAAAATATATATAAATEVNDVKVDDATQKSENLPQTPQKCGFFKRMRCFFSGCCG
jgi:ribosomal protein L12E/L44/L45/RPP1/RPP2